jgi:hypothetical protein
MYLLRFVSYVVHCTTVRLCSFWLSSTDDQRVGTLLVWYDFPVLVVRFRWAEMQGDSCTTIPVWLLRSFWPTNALLLVNVEQIKADTIIAIFMLEFVSGMQLSKDTISNEIFPKVFAWFDRYQAAVEKAKATAQHPTTLDGQAAADHILGSEFGHSKISVDTKDPTGLREGVEVEIYPADWGTEHRDRGRLVGLAPDEVTIAVKSKENVEFRIHAPRTGFKIKEV